MLTTALLVAATLTAAVLTAGEERQPARGPSRPTGTATPSSTLQLTADPTGQLAYDKKHTAVKAGKLAIRFVNKSPLPHNVTIAKAGKVVASTRRSKAPRRPPPRASRPATTSSTAPWTRIAKRVCRGR